MNLEVVKYCSTVLFLEESLPSILATNNVVSPNTTTISHERNGKLSIGERNLHTTAPPLRFEDDQEISHLNAGTEAEVTHLVDCNMTKPEPFDMDPLIDQIKEASQQDARIEENCAQRKLPSPGFMVEVVLADYEGTVPAKLGTEDARKKPVESASTGTGSGDTKNRQVQATSWAESESTSSKHNKSSTTSEEIAVATQKN